MKKLPVLIVSIGSVSVVYAHGSERGFVMLLPTGFYIAGGVIAVIASFALLAWVPDRFLNRLVEDSCQSSNCESDQPAWPSLVSFIFMCFLLVCGYLGNPDPLANPLPLFIWTWWWVAFTMLHCIFGNLWSVLNPWSGMMNVVRKIFKSVPGVISYPEKVGYFPALLIFYGFAWFELVDLAPNDPYRLANVVLGYWCFTFCGCVIFGDKAWRTYAEPFSIFFRLISGLSPFLRTSTWSINIAFPGTRLLNRNSLSVSGALFILLALSAVSFDGFSKTFTWLALLGINPLEYPGRSAVVTSHTFGLILAFLLLAGVYVLSVFLGCALIRRIDLFRTAFGRLVYSIIPIALAFHIAHYLTLLLVNSQYSLLAINDPFNLGWNLLAAKDFLVSTSFLNHYDSVRVIWIFQVTIIVTGHIIGIALAHLIAMQLFGSGRASTISQLFLAALMVFYTVFGLWLLSTPVIS